MGFQTWVPYILPSLSLSLPPSPSFLLQLWLCLAALCVIDEEHAEALSSGQWLGQDGKPKAKVHTDLIPRPIQVAWEQGCRI